MRKFIIQSRKGVHSIIEVECHKTNEHYHFLKHDEWMAKITSPNEAKDKMPDGSLVSPVCCWWSFYDSVDSAKAQLEKRIVSSITFDTKKRFERGEISSPSIDSVSILKLLSEVKVVLLK